MSGIPEDFLSLGDVEKFNEAIDNGAFLIDVREEKEYQAGHIPGAINRFHEDTIGADGLHLSGPELVKQFAGVGMNAIVYCGSGVTACHDLLVMSTIGLPGGRLYPGSWSEWSADPDREIATGP